MGGDGKIKEIAKWVRQRRIGMIGLVETMSSNISEHLVRRTWESSEFRWAAVDPQGRSGGILCVWEGSFIKDEVVSKGERWIWIRGFVQEIQMMGVISIVYGCHGNLAKARLWHELLDMKLVLDVPLFLMVDFNKMRKPEER